jgi:hypothetical protein
MVDKKTQKQTQKQTVKQTVKVVIGDTVRRRPRRRVAKRAAAKPQVITFIQGSASGAYVPASNTPFTQTTKLPVATGTEVRTKVLEIKGNNPALNTSGIISQDILPRLEQNSMSSNEDIESVVRGVAKQKDRARREKDEELIPLGRLGSVNVNMLDRNIPYIDDVKKAQLKEKEQAFTKARQERIKQQTFNEMVRRVNTNPNAEFFITRLK